ncbi:uncharacterized protein Z518_05903 [Rhinocladiella mackenziei CBS 650.93]|uniref:Carboxylesterase type B domain-containing protein n=1 Tax=Rhinocladiella mackenziei CBS 650.93 TaxID=1442369 RepID=A0A0D2IPH0_9EURO|nr:uncharacterized protein Z518_05903 [Rhinocladiella mackenziei CBS 650.93]KIX05031.1 hypothetical protein Z518_05903 [Rhinocladiella mackenziei CBS 650.93]
MTNGTGYPRSVSGRVDNVQVKGIVNPATEVENYLGIHYATITMRFRESQIVDTASQTSVLDATRYEPHCPQADHKTQK